MRTCFFSRFSEIPCDGQMDRCHLIPKQRIKREFRDLSSSRLKALIWHRGAWVWGCRRHHGDFDNYAFRLPRNAVPAITESFAEAIGMVWSLENDFPDA